MNAKFEKVTNKQAYCNVLNTNHKIYIPYTFDVPFEIYEYQKHIYFMYKCELYHEVHGALYFLQNMHKVTKEFVEFTKSITNE